jgi:hypothetical protein
MIMNLLGEREDKVFNNTGWKLLIELALRYGWKAAGAKEVERKEDFDKDDELDELVLVPASQEQDQACEIQAEHPLAQAIKSLFPHTQEPVLNSYHENSGRRVTGEDALALADALERALPDVPSHDALEHKLVEVPGAPGEGFVPVGTPVTAFEWFSGPNKPFLESFIAFCRQGGFQIW